MEELRAREDFDAARYRAFRSAVRATLMGRPRRLISLDQVLRAARREGQADRGVREMPRHQPDSCSRQSWSAASPCSLVTTLLGLSADGARPAPNRAMPDSL